LLTIEWSIKFALINIHRIISDYNFFYTVSELINIKLN